MNFKDIDHELYQKVISGINNRRNSKNTSEFSIPDLFSNADWESYSKDTRLKAGKRIKEKVDLNEIKNVVFLHKNQDDWAVYKIVL